jgi:hypothetical protein
MNPIAINWPIRAAILVATCLLNLKAKSALKFVLHPWEGRNQIKTGQYDIYNN